jgi:hypothetical protein
MKARHLDPDGSIENRGKWVSPSLTFMGLVTWKGGERT